MATIFPLFTRALYHSLDFRWGGTLIACIAALLAPIPIVLFFYGPVIRARSKFASGIVSTKEVQTNEKELAGNAGLPGRLADEANV